MTGYQPSNNLISPEDPLRSTGEEQGGAAQAPPVKSTGEEVPARSRPFLITEGGESDEPKASPDIFDADAWARFGPQTVYARFCRPLFNLTLFCAALLPALSLLVLISAANWIAFRDHKKIFFSQPRVGYRGKIFQLWKFRTMVDSPRPDYESWTEGQESKRVTPFGSILRRSHLDELPQLFNVLRGEMNFIGPRPEMVEINDWALSEVPLFYQRLAVKPGITGFAQITQGYVGNDIQAYRRKLEADLIYIKDLSLRRELGVLLVTPFWMLRLLGWQNDPADKMNDSSDCDVKNADLQPMPRPDASSEHAAQTLEEIDSVSPV